MSSSIGQSDDMSLRDIQSVGAMCDKAAETGCAIFSSELLADNCNESKPCEMPLILQYRFQ